VVVQAGFRWFISLGRLSRAIVPRPGERVPAWGGADAGYDDIAMFLKVAAP
jgi:hypothetical protein